MNFSYNPKTLDYIARFAAGARSLRLADGPDEVHMVMVSRLELKKYK